MPDPEPTASEPAGPIAAGGSAETGPRARGRPLADLRSATARRATVIGAGSFGSALAVLLSRAGLRTTLQTRTEEQAGVLAEKRENDVYLPGVELPPALRIEPASAGVARAEYVFLAVPSQRLGELIDALGGAGLSPRAAVVSVAKGLVPPDGSPPTALLGAAFGAA